MKRKEIANYIAQKHGMTHEEAKRHIKKLVSVLTRQLKEKKAFTLPGLGTFDTTIRKGRKYYMPWKDEHYFVPKKRVVQFHPSTQLKEDVKFNKMKG